MHLLIHSLQGYKLYVDCRLQREIPCKIKKLLPTPFLDVYSNEFSLPFGLDQVLWSSPHFLFWIFSSQFSKKGFHEISPLVWHMQKLNINIEQFIYTPHQKLSIVNLLVSNSHPWLIPSSKNEKRWTKVYVA